MHPSAIALSKLFGRWLKVSKQRLLMELRAKKVGDTDQLYRQLSTESKWAGTTIIGELTMLVRGRFVDMGVGRGHSTKGSTRGIFDLASGRGGRKPKRWYSRTWYGRLHSLHGAIGYKMMEQAIDTIKSGIKGK